MRNKKITEPDVLSFLQANSTLLPPLVVLSFSQISSDSQADARVQIGLKDLSMKFQFVIEAKSTSSPSVIQNASRQAQSYAEHDEYPMILVPYLSPERLAELEQAQVSGVDLCGNGIVIVPGRLLVLRTGQPNQYRDSRPLNNPYKGRSAMVARILLTTPRWESLSDLRVAIEQAGAALSLSQASKAIYALADDQIVSNKVGEITLLDGRGLLDKLGTQWRKRDVVARQALRLAPDINLAGTLSSVPNLKWSLTGESSVSRYTLFSQSGPKRIAVSNLSLAQSLLGGTPERVPNFADVELVETQEPGSYFANEIDAAGLRWASRLQTWLELQAGDGRQQDAARNLRKQILENMKS